MKKIHAKRVRRQTICLEFIKFLKMMSIYGSYRYFFAKNIDKPFPQNYIFNGWWADTEKLMHTRKDRNCKRSIIEEFQHELEYFNNLHKDAVNIVFFRWIEIYDNGKDYNISKIKLYKELFWLYLCDKGYDMSTLID